MKAADKQINKLLLDGQPPEVAYDNQQLSLFQNFLCNGTEERDQLSNTIEVWDGSPKYFVSRQRMQKLRTDKGHLPTLRREFNYRGNTLIIEILPARLSDSGNKEKEFYPSAREELVEDALRKIASEQSFGFLYGQESGVRFTLYMLRQELQRRGHTLSYQQVTESLEIMANCTIVIRSADKRVHCRSPILSGLISIDKEKYREDSKAKWFAYFSPLVTESIRHFTYRQYNYGAMMSHRTQLARWLHKRLAHHYLQASHHHPYTIRFSTIQRDSGLLEYTRQRDAMTAFEIALEELCDPKKSENTRYSVLLSFDKQLERGDKNKILDALYEMRPHPAFINEIKAANKRQQAVEIRNSDRSQKPVVIARTSV